MQSNYIGDQSKTSRTLGADDNPDLLYVKNSGKGVNPTAVFRQAPKVHRRNK